MLHPVGQQESEIALVGAASQEAAARSTSAGRVFKNRLTFKPATMR